ncbi:MAG: oligosaccharide flippase family protein [Limisphaerales bacterium]
MSLRRTAARGSATLAGAAAVSNIAGFVRNVILAHILTKADFGIAASLALVIALFELSAKIGVARFVVQDPEGNDPGFVASAHFLQFATAAVGAILILVSAPFLAGLFNIHDQGWAIASLALIALFRGLEHLDIYRFERELRFGPSTGIDAISQIAITVLAWPLATWLGDVRAVLALLIFKAALTCALTHRVAEYPYQWRLHRSHLRRMARLGWPLLINGFLMFGVLSGDQFLVATYYNVADLGSYAAAAALVSAPTFFFAKVFSSLSLPLVSKVQSDPVAFTRRYHQAMSLVAVFAVTCTVATIVGSEALMKLVYGAKYAGSGPILAWIAAGNAFRIIRMAPALAALSKGDSKNQMYSNVWRMTGLAAALGVALAQQPVWMIAGCALIGEAFACAASFVLLTRRDRTPVSVSLIPTAIVALCTAGALALSRLGAVPVNVVPALVLATLVSLAAGAVTGGVLAPMREECLRFLRKAAAMGADFRGKQAGRRIVP